MSFSGPQKDTYLREMTSFDVKIGAKALGVASCQNPKTRKAAVVDKRTTTIYAEDGRSIVRY